MNIFKQFFVSLYSPKDISTFRTQGIGKTILYVLLLTLISVLPVIYQLSTSISQGFQATQSTIKNELPYFTIENGELISDESAPITINHDDLTIVFDSTGTVTADDASRTTNSIFIIKNEFIYTMLNQSQSLPYSMMADTAITKDDLVDFLNSIDSLLPIFIPLTSFIIYLFSTISKFVGVSFLALIGLFLKNALAKELNYGQLWRLSAYSATLPTIFFAIMEALQTIVPSGFFIYWMVAIIILLLSIKEIPSSATPTNT